jgi:COP9 signalosome complex subunit 6
MAEERTISDHPSTSGLQIALHPLALLSVSDYITRHTLREAKGPIIGALLGVQSGREISVEEAYEFLVLTDDKCEVTVERAFFENKLRLCWLPLLLHSP